MPTKHVNYNPISASYDQRYEATPHSGTADLLSTLVRERGPQQILDVGCGTGRWMAELKAVMSSVVGLDLSMGMLKQARKREKRFRLACGRAEHLPFSNTMFDLVLCANALHHFDEPQAFVAEAHRLLRPGGALAVVGMSPPSSVTIGTSTNISTVPLKPTCGVIQRGARS